MTRVNVEENAFGDSRLARFERLMAWDRRTALGCLVLLWHDSQALMRVDGTEAEIADWCWALTLEEGKRIVAALEVVGYLTRLDTDRYLVHGNETQLENIVKRLTASSKGGDATRAKWAEQKAARLADSQAVRPSRRRSIQPSGATPDATADGVVQLGSIQCSAVQCSADQGSAGQNTTGKVRRIKQPDPDPTESDLAIAADWLAFAREEMPWKSASPSWTPEAFAAAIAKVRLKCGMAEGAMAVVLEFVKADSFWRPNAVSPAALLGKSKNGNRKIDNILLRMRTQTDRDVDTIKRWAETP